MSIRRLDRGCSCAYQLQFDALAGGSREAIAAEARYIGREEGHVRRIQRRSDGKGANQCKTTRPYHSTSCQVQKAKVKKRAKPN